MYTALIVEPFGWILRQCYNLVGSYGVAIIIFTLISKLIMLPFQMKSKKSMLDMQRIQPKLAELEKKYKDDKERYSREVQKLYKKENVSMLGGCLPLLITFPIMIGLYSVVRQPLTHIFGLTPEQITSMAEIMRNAGATDIVAGVAGKRNFMLEIGVASHIKDYGHLIASIAPNLQNVDFTFLGLDLTQIPNFSASKPELLWIIPALSGITSYGLSWVTRKLQGTPMTEQAKSSNGMMSVMMPLMSVWIAFCVPAGLGVYWIASNIFSAIQEPLLNIYYKNKQKKQISEGMNK